MGIEQSEKHKRFHTPTSVFPFIQLTCFNAAVQFHGWVPSKASTPNNTTRQTTQAILGTKVAPSKKSIMSHVSGESEEAKRWDNMWPTDATDAAVHLLPAPSLC